MRDALPQVVNTPELRFDCDDRRKFAVIEEVAARLRAAGANVADIDGVRVLTADGWWLLRASNTQAVLVARAEAARRGRAGAAEGGAGPPARGVGPRGAGFRCARGRALTGGIGRTERRPGAPPLDPAKGEPLEPPTLVGVWGGGPIVALQPPE